LDIFTPFFERSPQRRALLRNLYRDGVGDHLFRVGHHFHFELGRGQRAAHLQRHPQEAVGIHRVAELPEQPVERRHQGIRLIGLEPPRVELSPHGADDGVGEVAGGFVAPEYALQRRITRHGGLKDVHLPGQDHILASSLIRPAPAA